MATGLYLASTAPNAGKNTVALGLIRQMIHAGYNPAWHKPLGTLPVSTPDGLEDEDTLFMRAALRLGPDAVPPSTILVTQDQRMRCYRGEAENPTAALRTLYTSLSQNHDPLVISGADVPESGAVYGLDGLRLAREFGFKTILVDRIINDAHLDILLFARELMGDGLAGVIFNAVPAAMRGRVRDDIQPFLERHGVPVLGSIPKDASLASLQISQIMERLDARLLTTCAKTSRTVESFLIGTMQVENFTAHFRRKPKAAVIVGGDRSDIQTVAIDGGTSCLILTGNFQPGDIVLSRADSLGVPVLVTRDDTYSAARKVESLFSAGKLRDTTKIEHAAKLVRSSIDFTLLRKALEE